MTNACPTTSNRLSSATIGDVAHTFMPDTSGHITHYDACSDPDVTDCVADDAFIGGNGEHVSRGFTRHEHLDRTGLIHMNGRMYDPRLGRFLSPDPIVGDPTSSQSWNLYSYVGNNPLSYVDPTGLVQAGPRCGPLKGCLHFDGGGGGGSTTRTVTVTTTETVHGVMAVPYRYETTGNWNCSEGAGFLHLQVC